MEKEAAIEELKRCSGTQLDKEGVEAFIYAYRKGEI
jgi:HD-GYP domain-containing protein (c-di-GMP phosphodiesterase class II)